VLVSQIRRVSASNGTKKRRRGKRGECCSIRGSRRKCVCEKMGEKRLSYNSRSQERGQSACPVTRGGPNGRKKRERGGVVLADFHTVGLKKPCGTINARGTIVL